MRITEKDRLDLRQELERVFSNPRFAEIAMDAMPPIDYDRLATKDDLHALGQELRSELAGVRGELAEFRGELGGFRGELAEIRGELGGFRGEIGGFRGELAEIRGAMAELRGELTSDFANATRTLVASQLVTMVMLGGWVVAVT